MDMSLHMASSLLGHTCPPDVCITCCLSDNLCKLTTTIGPQSLWKTGDMILLLYAHIVWISSKKSSLEQSGQHLFFMSFWQFFHVCAFSHKVLSDNILIKKSKMILFMIFRHRVPLWCQRPVCCSASAFPARFAVESYLAFSMTIFNYRRFLHYRPSKPVDIYL